MGELCLGSLLSIAVKMPEETMVISDAAKSGDGTLANVGIKVGGKFKSPVNNQLFDSQEALDLHLSIFTIRRNKEITWRNENLPTEFHSSRSSACMMDVASS